MVDILANGDFGRDDGVKCDKCGSSTFLVNDQGGGLLTYECNDDNKTGCDETCQVQYENGDDDSLEYDNFDIFDPYEGLVLLDP